MMIFHNIDIQSSNAVTNESSSSSVDVYEKVKKSVVKITNFTDMASYQIKGDTVNNEIPFYYSFTGFIYDKEGIIVTSYEAVAENNNTYVTLYDDSSYPVYPIGIDPISDIAILVMDNMSQTNAVPITIDNSSSVKTGQKIYAIQNPFGETNIMEQGIVNGIGKYSVITSPYLLTNLLLTDIPNFYGSSGAPILNENGSLIGMTVSSVFEKSNAITSKTINKIVPSLIANGLYEHPWLGYSGTTLTPDFADVFGLPLNYTGVLIEDVVPNGPADKAGLHGMLMQGDKLGQQKIIDKDIVIAVDGKPVSNSIDIISSYNLNKEIGDNVSLTINRNGQILNLNATLESTPQMSQDLNSSTQFDLNNGQINNDVSPAPSPMTIIPGTSFYEGENFYIVGEVKNNLESAMNWVEVGITLYDENNRIIGTSSTYPNPTVIPPFGSSPFKFSIGPSDVSSVNAIKDWKITASYR